MASSSKQKDGVNKSIFSQTNNLPTQHSNLDDNTASLKTATANSSLELITTIKQEPTIPVIDVEDEINDMFNDQYQSINIYRKRKSDSDDIKIVKKFKVKPGCCHDSDDDNPDVQFFKSIRQEVAALNFDNKRRFKFYVMTKIHELLNRQRGNNR